MQVKTVVENEDGTLEFSGVLTPQELQVVVTVGLNVLYQTGAAPFIFGKTEMDDDDTLQ